MDSHLKTMVAARHIQNMSEAASLQPHWGYADRAVPCTNDAGSCAYLDVVYEAHDVGMLYMGILWASFGGILLVWAVGRRFFPASTHAPISKGGIEDHRKSAGSLTRLRNAASSHVNRFLLPDCFRPVFGRTTRLQVLVLAILCGYLTVLTFIGIYYSIWITPVKNMPGVYNTRTSLGPWADRIGVVAYAFTPLSVLLGSRESLLSILTGIPYQNFNFLHRWLGYVIVVQSSLHTIGWCVVEIRLYQPQPKVAAEWIVNPYMIWGIVAMLLLLILYALTLPPVIRLTGYEFFRKSHYVLAMVYIGACIGHWKQLECFLIPSLVLWFLDRAVRGVRTFLLHYNFTEGTNMGFSAAQAHITVFPDSESGDVVRMDFSHPHDAWDVGQHFYLCFPESSILQSHPFTPLNAPISTNGRTTHSYIFRAKSGETKKIAQLASKKQLARVAEKDDGAPAAVTTAVVLTGPYGDAITRNLTPEANILCVAGGSGITYVLPVLLSLEPAVTSSRKIELVWVVRRKQDADWVRPELDMLAAASGLQIDIRILATRETDMSASSTINSKALEQSDSGRSSDMETGHQSKPSHVTIEKVRSKDTGSAASRHPALASLVREFVDSTVTGRTTVFSSGPPGMMSDIRSAVAACNSGGKVWKGEDRFNVSLECDERMER